MIIFSSAFKTLATILGSTVLVFALTACSGNMNMDTEIVEVPQGLEEASETVPADPSGSVLDSSEVEANAIPAPEIIDITRLLEAEETINSFILEQDRVSILYDPEGSTDWTLQVLDGEEANVAINNPKKIGDAISSPSIRGVTAGELTIQATNSRTGAEVSFLLTIVEKK